MEFFLNEPEILIFTKSNENAAPAMLLEPQGKPVLAMNGKRVSRGEFAKHGLNTWTDRHRLDRRE